MSRSIKSLPVIICVVMCLLVSYHIGVLHVEQRVQAHLHELRRLEKILSAHTSICAATTENISSWRLSDALVREMTQTVEALESDQAQQVEVAMLVDLQRGECQIKEVELQSQLEGHTKDARVRQEAVRLRRDIKALQVSINETLHGEGMPLVLLRQGLRQLRHFYTDFCSSTPGCVQLTDAELMDRWSNSTKSDEAMREFAQLHDDMQRSEKRALEEDFADLSGIVFPPTLAKEGDALIVSEAPTFFNRSIHDRPLRGADTSNLTLQSTGVISVFEDLTEYAFCAYRHRNPDFIFQSTFAYASHSTFQGAKQLHGDTGRLSYLHDLVVSPLLQFCVNCNSDTWAQFYELACAMDSVSGHYGSHDFWVARSLIMASPPVQEAATRYYRERDRHTKNVLAVVLHQAAEDDRHQCEVLGDRNYGLHYQHLKARYPMEAALQQHVSEEPHAQCSPSIEQIIEHIHKVRKQAPYAFDHVYLSISEEQRSALESILQVNDTTQLKPLLLPAYTNTDAEAVTPGFTELVDLEIAGRATDIILSPFFSASRYVAEIFLLRHRMIPGGHVWTF